MIEDEFEFDGKTYVSVEGKYGDVDACIRCAFLKVNCFSLMSSKKIPVCVATLRKDGKIVYFVEKGLRDERK